MNIPRRIFAALALPLLSACAFGVSSPGIVTGQVTFLRSWQEITITNHLYACLEIPREGGFNLPEGHPLVVLPGREAQTSIRQVVFAGDSVVLWVRVWGYDPATRQCTETLLGRKYLRTHRDYDGRGGLHVPVWIIKDFNDIVIPPGPPR